MIPDLAYYRVKWRAYEGRICHEGWTFAQGCDAEEAEYKARLLVQQTRFPRLSLRFILTTDVIRLEVCA